MRSGIRKLLSRFLVACVAAACSNPGAARAGAFDIEEWGLATGIDDKDGVFQFEVFESVSNPFVNAHSVAVAGSSTSASYDFAWAEQFGTFLIQSTQQAEGSPPSSWLFTRSAGGIYITPSEDLTLHIDASWTYDLPVDWMETRFQVRVSQFGGSTVLFHREYNPQTFPGESASGTLAFDAQVTLPAGLTWIIGYEMELFTHGGTQGHAATGDGFVNFQLSPEPVTVVMLVLVSLLAPRRRSHRHTR